jgi:hypothetical protein
MDTTAQTQLRACSVALFQNRVLLRRVEGLLGKYRYYEKEAVKTSVF